ncbi:hypothetical protein PYR66_09965 [Klebsiella aerogenes]|nr:hypothetical protein PYR66_09965 [Klebsiella aerogenes]
MKKLIIAGILASLSASAMACDYNYTTDTGDEVCAYSGDSTVQLTTENGDEHDGHWIGKGIIQDDETGETTTVQE